MINFLGVALVVAMVVAVLSAVEPHAVSVNNKAMDNAHFIMNSLSG
jgi:hypothetical protein